MEIYTKFMPGGAIDTSTTGKTWETLDRIFTYAAEVLGENYTYTQYGMDSDTHHGDFLFTDPTGSGAHGWRIWSKENPYYSTIMSGGEQHTVIGPLTNIFPSDLVDFTALVWKSGEGSVGIGYQGSNGAYVTCFLLIKFKGIYNDTDVYGVTCSHGVDGPAPMIVHGHTDINMVNHCRNDTIGSGVYLHPLFDPISGCVSSDVFGVQTMENPGYAANGTIIKQGETSYMSVLGGSRHTDVNPDNNLFVKM